MQNPNVCLHTPAIVAIARRDPPVTLFQHSLAKTLHGQLNVVLYKELKPMVLLRRLYDNKV